MKKILCVLALAAASCGILGTSTGYRRSNVAEAVSIVVERHDSYVREDPALAPEQRERLRRLRLLLHAADVLWRAEPAELAELPHQVADAIRAGA